MLLLLLSVIGGAVAAAVIVVALLAFLCGRPKKRTKPAGLLRADDVGDEEAGLISATTNEKPANKLVSNNTPRISLYDRIRLASAAANEQREVKQNGEGIIIIISSNG